MWPFWSRKQHGNLPLQRLQQLEMDFAEVKSELDTLRTQHQKLSGRYYSRFGKKELGTQPEQSSFLTGADVLAAAGYRAGRPMPNLEE